MKLKFLLLNKIMYDLNIEFLVDRQGNQTVLKAKDLLGSSQSKVVFGQRVHQPEGDIHTVAGATVTLECRYKTLGSNDYIFWYKQEANAAPEFILSRFKLDQGKTAEKYADRYRCSMDASARQAPLRVERVKLSDLGVFYCALQPTLTHPLACLSLAPGPF
uniref:Ig-like domain-containing protein n=1 Tax=Hippocampus comes TaxID=109280 RepID=A0A3Q3DKL0_HIPCM